MPREDVDFRRGLAFVRLLVERLRDFGAFRAGLCLALGRDVFFVIFRAGGAIRETAFFTAGLSRPWPAALPATAPTIPPTTAAVGPSMLPSAAPATAPAVSFGIDGMSMFSSVLEFSAIKQALLQFAELMFRKYFAAEA